MFACFALINWDSFDDGVLELKNKRYKSQSVQLETLRLLGENLITNDSTH